MKIKKVIAAIAAAAMAVSMVAVNAFAATVALDSEYPGGWAASKGIPKAEFEAIGGDVKVVLTVEVKEPLVGEHNHLAKPMNMCVSWDAITDGLKSDSAIRKSDGFIVFSDGQTTCEFVVPESVWSEFKGYVDAEGNEDESAGLYFQVNDVIIKSAELSAADTAQGDFMTVAEDESKSVMDGTLKRDAAAAPAADTSTPAADSTTTSTATGNVPAAVMISVMAVAGAAAVASKKRK